MLINIHKNVIYNNYVDIDLSLMLNFPKIKKVLRDIGKLGIYLKEDQKYQSRNYQIDFQRNVIRKKNVKDPAVMHQEQKNKSKEQSNQEKLDDKEGDKGEEGDKKG